MRIKSKIKNEYQPTEITEPTLPAIDTSTIVDVKKKEETDIQEKLRKLLKYFEPTDNGLFVKGSMKSSNFVRNLKGWGINVNKEGDAYFTTVVAGDYIKVFVQTSIPTSEHINDLWYDSDDGNKLYKAAIKGADTIAAGEWEEVQPVGSNINNDEGWTDDTTANTKRTIFRQAGIPTALGGGDIWFDSDDSDKCYVATAAGDDEIKAGEWERVDVGQNPTLIDVLQATNAPAEAGATDGATAGDNLTDSGDAVLEDEEIKNIVSLNAGETINGATLPVAVYVKAADGEVYACDGNDTDKLNFFGFAISNSTDGNAIKIQVLGVVSGFTGLTTGSEYFVQDDKTLGTTPGTYYILVGRAVSSTQILIDRTLRSVQGISTRAGGASTTLTITHNLGKIPKLFKATIVYSDTTLGATAFPIMSIGSYDGNSQGCVLWYKSGNPNFGQRSDASHIGRIDVSSDAGYNDLIITASAMTATQITLTYTVDSDKATIVLWEAIG